MATNAPTSPKPRVFISHVHEDNDLCIPLLAALDAWEIDYWFDKDRLRAGDQITQEVSDVIRQRDAFIRICSGSMQMRPRWVDFETAVFQASLDGNNQTGILGKRILVNLIVDTSFSLDQIARKYKYFDTISRGQRSWIGDLRHALQLVVGSENPIPASPIGTSNPTVSLIHTHKLARRDTPRLLMTYSDEAQLVLLPNGSIAIRRLDDAAIWVRDSAVSQLHALITHIGDGQYELQDGDGNTPSTNGTWVNGKKLANGVKHLLQPGDEIQVGETKMRFDNS